MPPEILAAVITGGSIIILAVFHFGKGLIDRGAARTGRDKAQLEVERAKLEKEKAEIEAASSAVTTKSELEIAGLKRLQEDSQKTIQFQQMSLDMEKRLHKVEIDAEKQKSDSSRLITDLTFQVKTLSENAVTDRDALATAIASEASSREAFEKTNKLNQDQVLIINAQKETIDKLQTQLDHANAEIEVLKRKVADIEAKDAERHEQANKIQSTNMSLTAELSKARLALSTIFSAIPKTNMPPHVISELDRLGIDPLDFTKIALATELIA